MKRLWYFKLSTSLVLIKIPLAAEITYGVFNCLVYKMPSHSSTEAQVLALDCLVLPTNSLKNE